MRSIYDHSQLTFFPMPLPHHLFFAVRPPETVAREMLNVRVDLEGYGPYWTCPWQNLHATLKMLPEAEEITPKMVDTARVIGSLIQGMSFEVVFDRIENFGSTENPAVVLRCTQGEEEFQELYAAIARRLSYPSAKIEPARFTPHITLWRGPVSVREQRLAHPFRWTVDRFWLIHSFVGEGRHEWPGCWKLHN